MKGSCAGATASASRSAASARQRSAKVGLQDRMRGVHGRVTHDEGLHLDDVPVDFDEGCAGPGLDARRRWDAGMGEQDTNPLDSGDSRRRHRRAVYPNNHATPAVVRQEVQAHESAQVIRWRDRHAIRSGDRCDAR